MRTLAIGDIHGCLRAFDMLLDMVQPQADDLVITLGDYVDRGPDSEGVLDRLIELQGLCNLVPLKGNHEIMMLESRGDHFDNSRITAAHWQFLDECLPIHATDTHFFVHANAYPDVSLKQQPDHLLFWERLNPEHMRPHESGKIMVCGHTSQRSGRPLDFGFAVCIDTWVYGNGWLTCLDVRTGQYWQANQTGDMRTDWLDGD